ncbi:hypothetical protein [Saccharothrix algeriensis]|uniref:Secreted protein n=1 Tax=Saccharothrix algeriensis TaxID=173560 RepID=A0A8T8HX63_9PSEU|nr:hypothetical protein [Saccharothrix algeriensis]MBM7814722.1 hypothetical protein [Saccharothrix algeriensis]QTR03007.1 hypothetical protein J7S33_29120 [Saccharothrix algeriensis]
MSVRRTTTRVGIPLVLATTLALATSGTAGAQALDLTDNVVGAVSSLLGGGGDALNAVADAID